MKTRIQIDYEAMEKHFNTLSDDVETLKAGNSQLDSFVEGEIRSHWKGLAAKQFFAEWDLIRENLQTLYDAMQTGLSNGITILQIFHDAEEKAKSHFHK